MTRIFVIGSCRVWRPLRPFHANGSVALTNMTDPQWFSHTSRAAVQFVEIALGRRTMPDHLHQLIVETTPRDRVVNFDGRDAIASADLVLVEVSSLKSFDMDGYELNQHRVWGAGLKLPSTRITKEDVITHIKAIEDMTSKPVALLDHIPFDVSGEMIPARAEITDILANSGRPFVSKASFMAPEWVEDLNHHKKAYEEEIGRHILQGLGVGLLPRSVDVAISSR